MKKFHIFITGLCLNSVDAATTCIASNNAGFIPGGVNFYGGQPSMVPGMMPSSVAGGAQCGNLCTPRISQGQMGQGTMGPIMQPNIAFGAMPYQQGFNPNNQQGAGQWGRGGYPSNTNQGGAPTQCQLGQHFGNPAFGQPGWGTPGMGNSGLFMPGGAIPGGGQPGTMGQGMTQPGGVGAGICQAGIIPPSGFIPGIVQPILTPGIGANPNNNIPNNTPSNGQCECPPVQPGFVQGVNQPAAMSQPQAMVVSPVVTPSNAAVVPTSLTSLAPPASGALPAPQVDYGQSIVFQAKADAEKSQNQAKAEAQVAAQKAKADAALQVASTQKAATAAATTATKGVFSSAMSSIGSIFSKKK